MKTNYENLSDVLDDRMFNDIAKEQISGLILEGKPLMERFQISHHIRTNPDKHLTVEEQTHLYGSFLGHEHDEESISLIMDSVIGFIAIDAR
jgi:hypothetical protein